MKERGRLVRHQLPSALRAAIGTEFPWAQPEGRDGTGLKSRVPWTRVFDPDHSTSARDGWYAVYLFHGDGTGVTLSLNQGTTQFIDGAFKSLDPELLRKRVDWARDQLSIPLPSGDMAREIELGGTDLAEAYELGHVLGFTYKGELPDEDKLRADLRLVLRLLERLYSRVSISAPPGAPDPVVAAIAAEIDQAAGKRPGPGAPRLLSKEKRAAIEQHAMHMAKDLLLEDGWDVEDTHLTQPYDFIARRDGQKLYVEVKGTTTTGEAVILTKNEVRHHRNNPGEACLIVVRDIIMLEDVDEPTCTGGIREMWLPWTIGDEHLTPMAYEYQVRPPAAVVSRAAPAGVRTTATFRSA